MEQVRKYIPKEWIGKRYGHLVIEGYSKKMFDCRCDCGGIKRVKPTHLFSGAVKTCGYGCKYHNERYDGRSRERLYPTWRGMLDRCYNSNHNAFYLYGGRGISVCDEWRNDFWAFKAWAVENGYDDGLSLDRIDGNGDYEPSNCRWATRQQQVDNQAPRYTYKEKPKHKGGKRYELFGEMLTLPEIVDKYGGSVERIRYRLKIGMTLEDAVIAPRWFKDE